MKRGIITFILMLSVFCFAGCGKQKMDVSAGEAVVKETQSDIETALNIEWEWADVMEFRIAGEGWEAEFEPGKDFFVRYELINEELKDKNSERRLSAWAELPEIYLENREETEDKINQYFAGEEQDILTQIGALKEQMKEHSSDCFCDYGFRYYDARMDEKVISFYSYESIQFSDDGQNIFCGRAINFDTKTGEALLLADVVKDRNAFQQSVKEYVVSICQSEAYAQELKEDCLETIDEIFVDGLWYFSNEGIVFLGDDYRLTPYGTSVFHFVVPYGEIQGLDEQYAYEGGLQLTYKMGTTSYADLDGDGTKEELYVDMEDADGGELYIRIDGTFYEEQEGEPDRRLVNAIDEYVIVDIDKSDNTLEIAVQAQGESADPYTYFYQFDGSTLRHVGTIADTFKYGKLECDGKGVVYASEIAQIFETTKIATFYEMKNGMLVRTPNTFYLFQYYGWYTNDRSFKTVLHDVIFHEQPDKNSAQITVKVGDLIRVIACDDDAWIQVQTKDGKTWYVHCSDWIYTQEEGADGWDFEVFEPMNYAG